MINSSGAELQFNSGNLFLSFLEFKDANCGQTDGRPLSTRCGGQNKTTRYKVPTGIQRTKWSGKEMSSILSVIANIKLLNSFFFLFFFIDL
jgi:hypothetical protein